MSTIDERLRQKPTTKPKRTLSAGFTASTMDRIAQTNASASQPFMAIRRTFAMHLFTKPAGIAAAVAVLAMTAGTGYAALQWLQPNTKLNSTVTTLENGNKRFWVHSDACQGQDASGPIDSYYEIKAGSKTTPEDIRKIVEASCESDMLEALFSEQIQNSPTPQEFKPGDKQYVFPYVQLREVGADYIVVDTALNGETFKDVRVPLDKNARLYAKGKAIKLADLRPGKWLTLVSYTTALDEPYATEALSPAGISRLSEKGLPKGAIVEGIIERQYNVDSVNAGMGAMGEDWTRLVEDKNAPGGWKHLVPLND